MRTSPDQQAQEVEQQYKAHIAGKIRKEWGTSVPADASDEDVLGVWHDLNVPKDATPNDVYSVMDDAYGKDFTPVIKDTRNFGEKAQDVAGAVGGAAAPLVANVGAAMSSAAPAMAKVGGALGKTIPMQLGMAGYYGTKLAGEALAGHKLENTAANIPEPDIAQLRSKGYSERQIRNIVTGYTQTQQSLMQDIGQMGQEGVNTGAEAIANTLVAPIGTGGIEHVVGGIAGRAAAKAGLKGAVANIAGKVLLRGAEGAAIGAGFSAVDSATHRAAEAARAGEGADTILGHATKGLLGPTASNILGTVAGQPSETYAVMKKAAADTWKFGAILGASAGAVEGAVQGVKGFNAAREAKAAEFTRNARLISVQKFGDEFQPQMLLDRFKEDVQQGIASDASNVEIATRIVSKLHPDMVSSDNGLKTIATVAEKMAPWREWYERTNGPTQRPLLPTAQGINSEASQDAGQGWSNYLQNGDFRPDTVIPGEAPAGLEGQAQPQLPGVTAGPPMEGISNTATVPGFVQDPNLPPGVQGQLGTLQQTPGQPEAPTNVTQTPLNPGMGPTQGPPVGPIVPEVRPNNEPAAAAPKLALDQPYGARPLAPEGGNMLPPAVQPTAPAREPAPFKPPTDVPSVATEPYYTAGEGAPATVASGVKTREVGDHVLIEDVGPGGGLSSSEGVQAVIKDADSRGLAVQTVVKPVDGPQGGTISAEKQKAWYESHGFRELPSGDGLLHMRREPIGEHQAEVTGKLQKMAEDAQKRIDKRKGRLNAGINPADIGDHAIILASDMFTRGLRTKTAIKKWALDKWGDDIKPVVDKLVTKAQAHFERMFTTPSQASEHLGTLMDLFHSGKYGANWYENTAKWAKDNFGNDADMMLRFLAVTSANGQTETGATMALKAFAQWKSGKPFVGFRGPSMTGQLNRIAAGENLGEDTKIQQFYQALAGDPNAVVLDRWMMAALNMQDRGGSLAPSNYKIYAEVVRQLADMNGVTPRQFQAAVWEGARVRKAHITEKTGGRVLTSKSGSARPLEELVNRKLDGLSIDQYIEANHGKLDQMNGLYDGTMKVRTGEATGHTFDTKSWKPSTKTGYATTLASTVVPRNELYPATVLKFAKRFQPLIDEMPDKPFTVGLYNMGDGMFSVDFNVMMPDKEKSVALAFRNRQFAVGKIGEGGSYEGDVPTGYDPTKHGEQFLPPKDPAMQSKWYKQQMNRVRSFMKAKGSQKNLFE